MSSSTALSAPVLPASTARTRRRRAGVGVLLGALLGALSVVALPGAAHAADLTASPGEISVGEQTTIVATDLGGLETAYFGLGDTTAGVFVESGDSRYDAPASGGRATATFQAAVAGTVTIAVGDGETVLGTVQLQVSPAAAPQETVRVSLSPAEAEVGQAVTVAISGFGGLETASVGLSDNAAGTFEGGGTSVSLPVSGGAASTTFTPSTPGQFVIAVGDGETVLATATLTVTAASATPEATLTATPISAPVEEGAPVLLWVVVALAAVIVVGAVVWIVTARRARARRG